MCVKHHDYNTYNVISWGRKGRQHPSLHRRATLEVGVSPFLVRSMPFEAKMLVLSYGPAESVPKQQSAIIRQAIVNHWAANT